MNTAILVDIWQRLLTDPAKSWVVLEHGTCVVMTNPDGDLAEQETEIFRELGPVYPASLAGDFGVINLGDADPAPLMAVGALTLPWARGDGNRR